MTGDKNPAWNSLLTDEEREHKREHRKNWSSDYMEWAQAVKERDNFTCQACGRRGSIYLQSHHIVSWRGFPELRYNVENGVTLCLDCHKRFHRLYGRVNCDADDLAEFYVQTKRRVA
jgi:5-methylcytosine-specific restriction endonuclease McrA